MPSSTAVNGFPYPIGTDPVRDGDDEIKNLAEALDLKIGLIKRVPTSVTGTGIAVDSRGNITTTASTGTVVINGVFNAAWSNYKIIMTGTATPTAGSFNLRLTASGSPSVANYIQSLITNTNAAGPTRTFATNTAHGLSYGDVGFSHTLEVLRPAEAVPTMFHGTWWQQSTAGTTTSAGVEQHFHNVSTAYDGFDIVAGGGVSFTMKIRVYAFGQ